MNAAVKPASLDKNSEQAFFESQKLPTEKRGVTFEAFLQAVAAGHGPDSRNGQP
jgi:hypothetical protein